MSDQPRGNRTGRRRSRRRLAILGCLTGGLVLAALLVFLLASGSAPHQADLGASATKTLPDFRVSYPGNLTPENPPPGDHIAFLAEKRGSGGRPGVTLVVRRASHAEASLATDAALLNDLERFQDPGRRLLAKHAVAVPGAAGAFMVDEEYPDAGLGGVTVRHLDLIARGPSGASYHLVLAGGVGALTDAVVEHVVSGFRLSPAGA